MDPSTFFREIEHVQFPWRDRSIPIPAFYRDAGYFGAAFLTPLAAIRERLPSTRLHPVRIAPGTGLTTVTVIEYRDCDIGPYDEISIGFPVTIDRETSLLSRILPLRAPQMMSYILHLPVTTEFARDAGVEFYGFPKFVARIVIERDDGRWTGRLGEGGREILDLTVNEPPLHEAPQMRSHLLSQREGRLLRCESMHSACQIGSAKGKRGVELKLGDHPVADELRALRLGRAAYRFVVPKLEIILTPAIEGFDA
ncbi:MAG: acetoacetate decarboxylase family protein [Candidatus Bipolaricaulota bacterium]|nr:MAG: acetoacetate decarboxylase family protein [Candidatus Bipolaricaulota bacterium]